MLNVNAGADGSFLDLFDKSTSVQLFQKTSALFNVGVCVENAAVYLKPRLRDVLEMVRAEEKF